ncbi:ABC transporter substrate-binding protein [Lacticaseibacillus nasuensis]|uniref:ABC transporter substrate-binding protein n=1 Tax=Lacticaseibacillus nasuensis TaxID=944671 RepID=UPI00224693EE|nr:sugar ABC transporter substrate-binding protein [Lacticaseibacillus nasuensis]MCX2455897.1 sugar ABC transporter substrate-binding protein [Lacticaseibacillus nasuensis]
MKKWNFKRVMLTVATVTAGLFLLAGCGGKKSSDSKGKITIQYWNHWTPDAAEAKFFNAKIKEYEKLHPNIRIKQTNVPMNDYVGSKLTTAFATGKGPDVFSASAGTISNFIESGTAANLNDIFSKSMRADYNKSSLDAVTYKGKIIALPFEQDLVGLFYYKSALAEKNITPPKTWDELIRDAKELTTSKRAGVTFDPVKGAYETFLLMPFVWQTGSDFFTKSGKPNVDSKGVISALSLFKKFVTDGSANMKPNPGAADIANVGEGKTAFWIGGTFGIQGLEDKHNDKKVGVVPLPIPKGGKPASVGGGWRLVANSKSPHLKETKAFMKWLFLDKDGKHSIEYNTKAKFSYSPRKSVVAKAKSIYQKGLRAEFTNHVYGTERPEETMTAKQNDIIGDMIQNVLYKMSPKAAAKKAQAQLEAIEK